MLYNSLVIVYTFIISFVTPERMIAIALGGLGLYIFWMCCSLFSSFQRKFNSRCQDLVSVLIKTSEIEKHPEFVDKKADKISSGFGFGWKKFKSSASGKPSDFIKRREALDVEINGGLLNNGKTMMRAYITLITTILFIFNLVYVGGDSTLTFITLAQAMILPFVFYVVVKLFYFLHNSIKQKLYRMDVESFYELIDLLDLKFEKKTNFVAVSAVEEEPEEPAIADENPELEENQEEEKEPEEPENGLDKYDVFKKKNIDVSKIMNETPASDNSLPFINVDSDYVIKDDEQVGAKKVGQDDNVSSLFGMMQNTSGLKKNTFIDVEKNIAEIDNEKLDKINQAEEEKKEEINIEPEETQEVTTEENVEATEETVEEQTSEEPAPEVEDLIPEEQTEEIAAPSNNSKFIEIEKNENNPSSEQLQEENIANVVSGFKASRSKLASGGMVIERNEPISKRERSTFVAQSNETPVENETTYNETFDEPEETVINRPTTGNDADNVLSSLKSAPGGYDNYGVNQNFAPSTTYGGTMYGQNYGYANQPMYQTPVSGQMPGYGYNSEPVYPNYNGPAFGGYQTPQNYSSYDEPEYDDDEIEEDDVGVKPAKKKVTRTKENEPRPRNLKSKSKKQEKEEESNMAKRGRPKKQEVSESMVIENDKQFNEILSRAEKLMRKSEEGLSESQSKRIEKEIKILMDAMNRYKESK